MKVKVPVFTDSDRVDWLVVESPVFLVPLGLFMAGAEPVVEEKNDSDDGEVDKK